ncbi:MAG TPA: SDR family oxidoreductase [Caulobacteraceae bacterium]|jgi:uncharacterized protein YbjT (DUF2867 family)|nr:SDR family oxidoreductase [Caulobacteraceae bacterium]
MRVLVVGAYGLIGGYVASRLLRDGHEVIGAGRSIRQAQRRMPRVRWARIDLTRTDAEQWARQLVGIDAVVNCAGALQDGPRDDLEAVHVAGVLALARACELAGIRRFIQVSAAGVETGDGAFSRTKREADQALSRLDLDWVILRPGLVLAPAAFGGSALLRGLAAFPGIVPAIHAEAVVQAVAVEDVAEAVARSVRPDGPTRIVCGLAAAEPTRLADVLLSLRAWLGLGPAPVLALPPALGHVAGWAADALGWLGWRSPMRSAALKQLAEGVRVPSGDAQTLLGMTPVSLGDMLAQWPSGVQDRWFGRLYFLKPLLLLILAVFWMASGAIGLLHAAAAERVLVSAGFAAPSARAAVLAGSVVDLLLGALIGLRRTAPAALMGTLVVTAAYLVGATLWRPDLWGDPLGPLLKTLPAAVLSLVALAIMDER